MPGEYPINCGQSIRGAEWRRPHNLAMFKDMDQEIVTSDEARVLFHKPENQASNKMRVGEMRDLRLHVEVKRSIALHTLSLLTVMV